MQRAHGERRTKALAWVICGLVSAVVVPAHAQAAEAELAREPAHTGLRVESLRPGLDVIEGAGGNVVVWSGSDGVVLVDSGLAARAAELFETVAHVAPGALRFVVNTHGHADHTGGNETAAARGAVIVGHESLRELGLAMAAASDGNAEPGTMAPGARPMVTTNAALALHLNGDRLDALHVADAHTSSDLVLRWAQADVVALGDIYWNGHYPYIDLPAGGSLAGVVAAVEAALARATPRTLIVPGHGAVSTRTELAAYRDMLVAVGRKVREAVERGEDLQQVLAGHPTVDFDARFAHAGASVSPEDFVRNLYADLTRHR